MTRLLAVCAMCVLLPGTQPAGAQMRSGPNAGQESWAQRRSDVLAERLAMTDAQRQQTLAIFIAVDKECEPVDERLLQARRALRAAIRRNAGDAELDGLAATVGGLTGQLEAIQAKADRAFFLLLTPAQREKFAQRPGLLPYPRGGRR